MNSTILITIAGVITVSGLATAVFTLMSEIKRRRQELKQPKRRATENAQPLHFNNAGSVISPNQI
jgi:predicted alpha/beta-hydrolase family hydrolase